MTIQFAESPGLETIASLVDLTEVVSRSGDPDRDFFYLGGPMTGYPQFNFPRFHEVGEKLRAQGYNIVSPAELDDSETADAAMQSPDGAEHSRGEKLGNCHWEDFLARDLIVCSLPTCVGGIFIEGWEKSKGALLESYVLDKLNKQVLIYDDSDGKIVLDQIDRDEHIVAQAAGLWSKFSRGFTNGNGKS